MQHDIYSWQLEGKKIINISKVTNGSEMVNGLTRTWLKNTTPKQRENFINMAYEIIAKTNVTTVHELSSALLKNIGTVVSTYRNIDESERKELAQVFKTLVKTSFNTIKEEIPNFLDNR